MPVALYIVAVIFKLLAVFECYSLLGNSVTYQNIVDVYLRQNLGRSWEKKGKVWGIVPLGMVEA